MRRILKLKLIIGVSGIKDERKTMVFNKAYKYYVYLKNGNSQKPTTHSQLANLTSPLNNTLGTQQASTIFVITSDKIMISRYRLLQYFKPQV